jgi:hypothetical protein
MPGTVCNSVVMLRPLIGSCSMRFRSSTWPKVGLETCSNGVTSSTDTSVTVCPTLSTTSTTALC